MRTTLAACLAFALALTACGDRDTGVASRGASGSDDASSLPMPAGASGGGVTGMPAARAIDEAAAQNPALLPEAAVGEDATAALPGEAPVDPMNPASPEGEPRAGDVSPQDAVNVVRDYYAALNSGAYSQAYALWDDGGRASGQSAQQFAEVFSQTEGYAVELSAANSIQTTAESRQTEVPVSLTMRQRDGAQRRFIGRYVLRFADNEGAWRIVSADLREMSP